MTDATPSYESCPQCGTNRIYDDARTRYLFDDAAMLGPIAEPASPDSSIASGCTPNGHIWEPHRGVSRCARCNVRKVQLNDEWAVTEPREIILPMRYMGKDLTELTSDPENCAHDWEPTGDSYQCEQCGLIDHMPY